MKNRIPKAMQKLPSDKIMKQEGRGTSASFVRGDGKLNVVKWFDNKPVLMLSAVHAKEPEDTCQRWSKKDKRYITVRRPNIVQEHNAKMGGVDLSDRMMSYYRMSVRTRKWTTCLCTLWILLWPTDGCCIAEIIKKMVPQERLS